MDFNILELLKKAINPIKQGIQHPIESIKGQSGEMIGNDLPYQGGILGNMKPQGGEMFGMPANMAQQNVGNSALMNAIKGSPDGKFDVPYDTPLPLRGKTPTINSTTTMPTNPSLPPSPSQVGTPANEGFKVYDTPDMLPPSATKGGFPVEPYMQDRIQQKQMYRQQLEDYDPKENRLKSALFGAAYGGLQGLASGGDWQSGLAGAATGGGIGLAQPKLYGQFKRQQLMSETDEELQRAIKGEEYKLGREGTLADIEGRRAQTEDIRSRPIESEKERRAREKEGDKNRATTVHGQQLGALGRADANQTRRDINKANNETKILLADKNNAFRKSLQDANIANQNALAAARNDMEREKIKADKPRIGQTRTLTEIKELADTYDMSLDKMIAAFQLQGGVIDLDR